MPKKRTAWNKGLKLSETPQYVNMGFKKGNRHWDNEVSRRTQFKKGERPSPATEFQKGRESWWKGKERPEIRGSGNPAWIADREKVARNNRSKDEYETDQSYKVWMRQVKNRDGWSCKMQNNDCQGNLYAHHILNWVDYPELRYEVNNGITLCHAHHPRGRAKEKRLAPVFQRLVSVSSKLI